MVDSEGFEETAEELVDEALPPGLDWEYLVRTYPVAALSLAAVGGFMLGWKRGTSVMAALSAFAARELSEHVNELLGERVL